MGVIKGGKFQDNRGISYNYMLIWGRVVADPRVSCANTQRVGFTVKIHSSPSAYMNCVVWGDGPVGMMAASLEADEYVFCCGTWNEREYTNKKGEHKKYSDLNIHVLIPMSLLGFALSLYGTKQIRDMVNVKESDPVESADDYVDVEQEEFDDYQLNM